MRRALILLILAGCQQVVPVDVQPVAVPAAARELPEGILQSAEQVAVRAVEASHPHLNPAPVANCVRDNASNAELLVLADGTKHSTTAEESAIIAGILARASTQKCLTDNGQTLGG